MSATSTESAKDTTAKAPQDKAPAASSNLGNVVDPTPASEQPSKAGNVTTVTKSEAFDRAKAAGEAHDKLLNRQGEKAESVGRTAVYEALRFAEQFRVGDTIDRGKVVEFLAAKAGKPVEAITHGRVTNEWQPVAKAFAHEGKQTGAQRQAVSKRGQALAALIAEKVRSEDLMVKFKQEETVGSKKGLTGVEKYVSIYKRIQREQKEAEEAETGKKSSNPFDNWSEERLAKSAKDFLAALHQKGFLSEKVSRIEDLLAGEALDKAKAS